MAKIDTLLLTKMAKRTILFGPHKRVILERERRGGGVKEALVQLFASFQKARNIRDRDDRRTLGLGGTKSSPSVNP